MSFDLILISFILYLGRTEGDMLIAPRFNGQFRNVLNDKYSKWPNKTVPYEFAPGFSKQNILQEMQNFVEIHI